ncbi:hypothetical protein LUZ60_004100 [Juncus effusus]|nr:hypothetical protein LUZ60_004100 [Juncus effusus]
MHHSSVFSSSPFSLRPFFSPFPFPRCLSVGTGSMAVCGLTTKLGYEEALSTLSSLITKKVRGDGSNRGDQFNLMFNYLEMLDLEEAVSQLKIIHVAGTKGKGSTCTFSESILRCYGMRTGLFTSPHLMDVRERFRINGVEISEEKFLKYFWWCWDRLKEKTKDEIPMPTYFRFLALLAFKIFSAEQVDVAVLEVGLGGKFDATNVVKEPIVCGITSLGYDHMEILGNTLGEIAGEKAGILKKGAEAYTVPQPAEAMSALEHHASQLGVCLKVIEPLDPALLKGENLGIQGDHQYINASLAIALTRTWLQNTGHNHLLNNSNEGLAEEVIRGLRDARLQGRAQIERMHLEGDDDDDDDDDISPIFYLDGAHSPESMEMCAKWFSRAIKQPHNNSTTTSKQILIFNCMSVRDPDLLLPRLISTCAQHGVKFDKALFVPNMSQYNKVGTNSAAPPQPHQIDLSWQLTLQRVWEKLVHANKGESSSVFGSLPDAVNWLRETSGQNRSTRFQVLVTGSLHLVGDVLRLIKK